MENEYQEVYCEVCMYPHTVKWTAKAPYNDSYPRPSDMEPVYVPDVEVCSRCSSSLFSQEAN